MRAAVAVVIAEAAAAVGLAEGEAGVRAVVAAVARLEPASTRALSRETGLPVPIVAAVCGELRRRGVLAPERPSRLAERWRGTFAQPPAPGEDELVAALASLAADAPPPRSELDQSHCTVETKARRALFLQRAGALAGRRVLFLGDDDLTSLAVRQVGAAVAELAVVDVDPAVLRYLRRQLPHARLVEHDLREPLPDSLTARFDTVFTDPPYTVAGAELFLSRAAAALRPQVGGSVFLAFGPKPPAETLRVQAAIAAMGLVIRSFERNFNDYVQASILGGTSHLYHLTSTAETAPLVAGGYGGALYTGEGRPPRRYRCASCRTVHLVGRGARWTTVDVLRREGCPECGAARFLPLPHRTRA
ncbi:MAG TPA: bis-aminopropyl spermidine synthase family protein [Gaiellaceae bacterium]|nr:bis-aminopropyl spermidine synthase family protein [Gaiellaceae bacterium]